MEAGGIRLEPQHRQVVLPSGSAVGLTSLELRVLYLLMTHRGQVLPFEALVLGAWGRNAGSDARTLWNAVHRLRCKIEPDPRYPHILQTVPGKGYAFCG